MGKAKLAPIAATVLLMGAVGLSQLQTHEGRTFRPYRDPVGIPTVCYGHTGPDVRMGPTYSQAQCDTILVSDIRKHKAGLARCVTRPVTQNQADAVVSLAFNIGDAKVCRSTLVRKLNRGDILGTAAEFPKWKYARVNGRNVVLRGLVSRRADERALFLSTAEPKAPAAQYAYLTK